jgi:hypothetical protein
MSYLFKRKDASKKEKVASDLVIKRMQNLTSHRYGRTTKIQCSWPLHDHDVYSIYENQIKDTTWGLTLTTVLDPQITEKRLTENAKSELIFLAEGNRYAEMEYGHYVRFDCNMSKEVFSKEESYCRKPVKYVVCKDLRDIFQQHLTKYFNNYFVDLILSF